MRSNWNKTNFDLSVSKGRGIEYNGLTDPNLVGFFASPLRKKILLRQNLISNEGGLKKKFFKANYNFKFKPENPRQELSMTPAPRLKCYKKKEIKQENSYKRPAKLKLQPITSEKFKELLNNHRRVIL